MEVTAIFDIGKTNKKFLLFDGSNKKVFETYQHFDEILDDDGFPCENLTAILQWIDASLQSAFDEKKFQISALNFSTYGASFVHIDNQGNPVAPLYNYLKPFPEECLKNFHETYGDPISFSKQTASPPLGMLNSGLQLYWLKHIKPEIFKKIRWSLHLPQFLSFIYSGIPVSEYTSIGCHTGLWDYSRDDYHRWVYEEEIYKILPPIVNTSTSINQFVGGNPLKIGVGIHDSSAALIPYIRADRKPFALISTGTWSISINPFNDRILSSGDLRNDCLSFLQIDGTPTMAARLFLGHEHKHQIKVLNDFFKKPFGYYREIRYNRKTIRRLTAHYKKYFNFSGILLPREQPLETDLSSFKNFKEAYHQLILELVEMQILSTRRVMNGEPLRRIYIDGGFADNVIYTTLLQKHFTGVKIRSTRSPIGSAIGACIVISDQKIDKTFLKINYALRKH